MRRSPLRRATALVSLLVVAMVLAGCSLREPPPAPKSTEDPSVDWLSITSTKQGGTVVDEVSYRSGDLEIRGQVCRPADDERHPVIIWNHGGVSGIDDRGDPGGVCVQGAKFGYVFAESSYRGEDGSDGEVEVCLGEVDDVLAMIDIVRAQPYADRNRVAMIGVSHGGCITTRAVERGAPVDLAVDIAGPTDWAEGWKFATKEAKRSSATDVDRAIYTDLAEKIELAAGGTPRQEPDSYRSRSPVEDVSNLKSSDQPFLIVHGTDDSIVPLAQSCELARRMGGFRGYLIGGSGESTTPDGCGGITWTKGPPPSEFPGDRYLLVYDGVNHLLVGTNAQRLTADYLAFIALKLPD